MADIFISYRQQDRGRVEALASRLRDVGLDVWFDARLRSGASFDESIATQLRDARTVLVAWTPAAMDSEWVRSEAAMARGDGRLVACFLEPTQLAPPFNLLHAEDLIDWHGEDDHRGWTRLLAELCLRSGRPGLEQWGKLIQTDDEAGLRRWIATAPPGPLRAAARFHLSEQPDFSASSPPPARRKPSTLWILLGAGALLVLGAIGGFLLHEEPGAATATPTIQGAATGNSSQTAPPVVVAAQEKDPRPDKPATPANTAASTRLAAGVEHRLEIGAGGTMDLDRGTSTDRIEDGSDFIIAELSTGSPYYLVDRIADSAGILGNKGGTPTRATCGRSDYTTHVYLADPGEYNCFRTSEGRTGVLVRQRNREGFSGVVISYRFWD